MSMISPSKPSCLSVIAAVPPARLAPTMTNCCGMQYLLLLRSQATASPYPGVWRIWPMIGGYFNSLLVNDMTDSPRQGWLNTAPCLLIYVIPQMQIICRKYQQQGVDHHLRVKSVCFSCHLFSCCGNSFIMGGRVGLLASRQLQGDIQNPILLSSHCLTPSKFRQDHTRVQPIALTCPLGMEEEGRIDTGIADGDRITARNWLVGHYWGNNIFCIH